MTMSIGRKSKLVQKPWRPDFRDAQLLPDLKIVRTHFLLNLVAGMVLLISAGVCVYQEYEISARAQVLGEMQANVSSVRLADQKNVADSARFMRDARKALEVASFAKQPMDIPLLLVKLSAAQPEQCIYSSLDFQRRRELVDGKPFLRSVITLKGTMAPSVERSAPLLIGDFVATLRSMDIFRSGGYSVELVSHTKDRDLDYFNFNIEMKLYRSMEEAKK